jgi:uncharacterized protein (DUF983 family)
MYSSHVPGSAAGVQEGGAPDAGRKGRRCPPADAGSSLRRHARLLWAIVRLRCPRCRTGRLFRGMFAMNDPCPVCGLIVQREEGYFLGAMYISYALSVAVFCALFFTAAALLPDWDSYLVASLATVLYLPLTPAVFRMSRVLWIYLDRAHDPNEGPAGSFEKQRLQQLQEGKKGRRRE